MVKIDAHVFLRERENETGATGVKIRCKDFLSLKMQCLYWTIRERFTNDTFLLQSLLPSTMFGYSNNSLVLRYLRVFR